MTFSAKHAAGVEVMKAEYQASLRDEHNDVCAHSRPAEPSRRMVLQAAAGCAAFWSSGDLFARLVDSGDSVSAERFPHFKSTPVSYRNVKMQDAFWLPRQKITRDVSIQWVTSRHDGAGGLNGFKRDPQRYVAKTRSGEMEHIKFIEAMSTAIGVENDPSIAGLIDAWIKPLIAAQGADGYLGAAFPPGVNRPPERWQPAPWSHEDYTIGHYLEAAIAHREATGKDEMYRSALRAVNNMSTALLDGRHAYTSGHPEIEQALMRLYGLTGDTQYLRLCGWLLDQRGRHEGRRSFGRRCQDHLPIKAQRTIEGHAVKAAFLFNGVTHYVGATGDAEYREAVLAVWDDLIEHKMYVQGASGNKSSRNEGYRMNSDCIPPDDTYGESCAAFGNFQWAHSLFRLTGEARYLDTAERILYNAFSASLSLQGDSSFYGNPSQTGLPMLALAPGNTDLSRPATRSTELATSCCPPNIVKLINKVGGFFYSTAPDGIYVNHYGASQAEIEFGNGVQLTQRTAYPWDGTIYLQVRPKRSEVFTLRLRVPAWAAARRAQVNETYRPQEKGKAVETYRMQVNGKAVDTVVEKGWLAIRRRWKAGDEVTLTLPMSIERVALPPRFKEYENLIALQRGPIVYCLEEQDVEGAPQAKGGFPPLTTMYIPQETPLTAEHRLELLGGVTTIRGEVRMVKMDGSEIALPATFIPYCVWGNRGPSAMSIWLGAAKAPFIEFLVPQLKQGETCVG